MTFESPVKTASFTVNLDYTDPHHPDGLGLKITPTASADGFNPAVVEAILIELEAALDRVLYQCAKNNVQLFK